MWKYGVLKVFAVDLLRNGFLKIKLKRQLYPIAQIRALEEKERTVAIVKFQLGMPVEMKNQSVQNEKS